MAKNNLNSAGDLLKTFVGQKLDARDQQKETRNLPGHSMPSSIHVKTRSKEKEALYASLSCASSVKRFLIVTF